jgi:hypothetical protein
MDEKDRRSSAGREDADRLPEPPLDVDRPELEPTTIWRMRRRHPRQPGQLFGHDRQQAAATCWWCSRRVSACPSISTM